PISRAKSDCERLVRSRIARTPDAPIVVRREGSFSPRKTAPASRTLSSSSSNVFFFISKLFFNYAAQLQNLFGREIFGHVLGIHEEQQNNILLPCPVVNDPRSSAFSPPTGADTNFTNSRTTLDQKSQIEDSQPNEIEKLGIHPHRAGWSPA